jgi:hypothetical protein
MQAMRTGRAAAKPPSGRTVADLVTIQSTMQAAARRFRRLQ